MDFDNTQNIFIESDNLEALKILQKSYAGKIKMIYIDPPYNTGNDFIYHDDFSQSKKDYEIATGDRNINGELLKSFKKNSKDNGHYHSNWLNMMLPRLHLARTLLSDDGVIFISIDDNEQAQLKLLCDEIFGGENLFASMIVTRSEGGGLAKRVIKGHDYLLAYTKNYDNFKGIFKPKDIRGKIISKDGVDYWIEDDWLRVEFGKYGTLFYEDIVEIKGVEKKEEIDAGIKNGTYVLIPKDKKHIVGRLRRIDEDGSKFYSILKHLNKDGVENLKSLNFDKYFSYPKPISLIKELILGSSFFTKNNGDIILDFFAGSATTAHAVMQLNSEDKGNRQFIMVQLPEILDTNNASTAEGKKIIQNAIDFCNENNLPTNIAEISKERIRRAGAKIKAENPEKKIDTGFKVFKLSDSNFKAWQIDDDISKQLEMYIDPLKDNANEMDIVYELLLKMGLKLTATIECNNGVYWLTCENKSYAIVLNLLSQDDFNAIIAQKPTKTVVLDKAFLNDSEKSNVMLQFKDAGLNFESI
ncbi:site-specific DNA-methyltransferase [Moraxella sp. Pampa]|uniref:site-specific DNA-methyltransferase n=1 Tax=Moraxella sp. Pampa TaxID=3111978 RepID=UPI003A5CBB07